MYFETYAVAPLTPALQLLEGVGSFLQAQPNSSVAIFLTAPLPAGGGSLDTALHSYMGNLEMWSSLDQ